MRAPLLLALLLVISIPLVAQTGFCPSTPDIGNLLGEQYFVGTIGQKSVRMYLAHGDRAAVGVFYYTDDWTPHLLSGNWDRRDLISITDKTEMSPGTGRMKAHIAGKKLVGTWTPFNGATLPVQMKQAYQPDCDAKNDKWLRFSDPQWPITFSYPASWRLDVDAHNITIRCPDPSLMAYSGFSIGVTQGTKLEDVPMTRCEDKWYSPVCDCADLSGMFCDTAAPVAQMGDMVVIDGDRQEWRGYCLEGGYLGQTDGTDRIVIVGDKWVEFGGQGAPAALIERIIESAAKR